MKNLRENYLESEKVNFRVGAYTSQVFPIPYLKSLFEVSIPLELYWERANLNPCALKYCRYKRSEKTKSSNTPPKSENFIIA